MTPDERDKSKGEMPENPEGQSGPDPDSESSDQLPLSTPPQEKRKRKWLKRLAIASSILLILLVLLIAVAPMIATSSWVENKVAALASERLGRKVTLEGIRAGWRTQVRLERLRISPEEGEADFPPFVLQDVHAPITLWGLLSPPYNLSDIKVERLEVNAVRAKEGTLNFLQIAEKLPEAAEPPPPPEEAEEPPRPIRLPIEKLGFEIEEIALRWVDLSGPEMFQAGIEEGKLTVNWAGNSSPLRLSFQTTLFVNQVTQPLYFEGHVEDWVQDREVQLMGWSLHARGDGKPTTPDSSEAPLRVDLAMKELPVPVGEISLDLPLAPMARFASAAIPEEKQVEAGGRFLSHLVIKKEGELTKVSAELSSKELSLGGKVFGGARMSPPDILFKADASIDVQEQSIQNTEISLRFPGIDFSATAEKLPFGLPAKDSRADLDLEVELGKVFQAAATTLGKSATTNSLTGSLKMEFASDNLSGPGYQGDFAVDWEGGELRSLRPFVTENPDFLTTAPLNLEPTSQHVEGRVRFHSDSGMVEVEEVTWRGPADRGSFSVTFDLDEPLRSLNLSCKNHLTFSPLMKIVHPYLPPALEEFSGGMELFLKATGREGGVEISGDLLLNDQTLRIRDLGRVLQNEDLATSWSLNVEPVNKSLTINTLSTESRFFNLQGSGKISASQEVDLSLAMNFVPSPFLETANALGILPLPLEIQDSIRLGLLADGNLSDQTELTISLDTTDAFEVNVPDMVHFTGPVHWQNELSLNRSGESTGVTIHGSDLTVGDALAGRSTGFIGYGPEGLSAELLSNVRLNYGPVLETIDPSVFESYGALVSADGATSMTARVSGRLSKTEDGFAAESPWSLLITEESDLQEVAWQFRDLQGEIAGVFDERRLAVLLNPLKPMDFVLKMAGESGLEAMSGPIGLAVEEVRIPQNLEMDLADTIAFGLEGAEIGVIAWQAESFDFLSPPVHFSLQTQTDLGESSFRLNKLNLQAGEFLTSRAGASFNWNTKAWDLQTSSTIAQADLGEFFAFRTADSPPVPVLTGEAIFDADFSGTIPGEGINLQKDLPLKGLSELTFDNFGLDFPGLAKVGGISGDSKLKAQGRTVEGDVDLGLGIVEFPAKDLAFGDWSFKSEAIFRNYNVLEVSNAVFEAEDLGASYKGSMRLTDLERVINLFLENEAAPPELPLDWLNLFGLNGEMTYRQNLAPLAPLIEEQDFSGVVSGEATIDSEPRDRLRINLEGSLDQLAYSFGEMFSFAGLNGKFDLVKTIRLGAGEASLPSPPSTEIRLETASFNYNAMKGSAENVVLTLRGLNQGVSLDLVAESLLGGPAKATLNVRQEGADPVLSGFYHVTGADGRSLMPEKDYLKREQAEINGFGSYSWRIGRSDTDIFDTLNFTANATRIGREALPWFLRALDPEGANPAIRNALLALRLGYPESAYFELKNGLVTTKMTLRTAPGFSVNMPILQRSPFSNIASVYGLDRFEDQILLTRRGLLFLLAEDASAIHDLMNETETEP